jgi:hypothetical protein
MPSFGVQLKPEVQCCKILQHVKVTFKYEQKYFTRTNSSFPSPIPSACYQMTAGKIVRELWSDVSRVLLCSLHSTMFSKLMYHLEDEQYALWWPQIRRNLTPSTSSLIQSLRICFTPEFSQKNVSARFSQNFFHMTNST